MGKRKAKRPGKVLKWVRTHIAIIGIGASVLLSFLVVAVFLVMMTYAWMGRRTVEISFSKGWPPIFRTRPDKPKEEIVELSVTNQDALGDTLIPIGLLPEGLRGSRQEALLKIAKLYQESEGQRDNIWHCCRVISLEIALHGSIDTRVLAEDDYRKEVYRAIQILLNVIGYWDVGRDGQLDGDQGRTKVVLGRFQKAKEELKLDWKLGPMTFRAMLAMITKLYGMGESGELVYCQLR